MKNSPDEASLFFREHGYYHARGIFNGSFLSELTSEFNRILTQLQQSDECIDATWGGEEMARLKSKQDSIFHTHNVQKYSAHWLAALLHRPFLDLAECLIGPNIILHHSKLFHKPPFHGAPFPSHQDWSYFPTQKDSMIAAVIHLSPATEEMGCLRVFPGSHNLGRIANSHGQSPCQALLDRPIEEGLPLEAEPGDVVFFHYFTVHGSLPNRSEQARKTVLVQLYDGNDCIEPGNDHPNERLVLRGWNVHSTRNNV